MFLFIYEFLGHGNIACVVHIYNLVDAVGLKVETLVNERALKIAHSGNALLNALVEYRECLVGDGVDTARHIFRAIVSGIAESLDVHTRFVHFHIQWFFVFNKWSHRPHAIVLRVGLEGVDIASEVLLTEMVSTVVRQNLPFCITLLNSQKLCIELGVVFTTTLSGTGSWSVLRNSRTSVMCSFTMMLMLSALHRQKILINR